MSRAFTLVEMLVVIAIIAVLAALLLPALTRGKQRAQRIQCIANLKEMGTAFQMFAHDHSGKFPMQTPKAEGGSEEYVEAANKISGTFYFSYRHLQTLGNELVMPRLLVCPTDRTREPAPGFGTLQNSNVSYFVSAYADYNESSSVLAGDRNITNSTATASLVRGAYGLEWTSELHSFKGNVLFADGHVEQWNNPQIELSKTAANSVFFLPAVKPTFFAGGAAPEDNQGPSTATAQIPQSSSTRLAGSGNAGLNVPAQPTPVPMKNGMANSQVAALRGSNSVLLEVHARETTGTAALSDVKPAAATPAANDDDEAPSLRLLGAVRSYVATSTSWWMWLLLTLLIALAAFLYSRNKMRRQTRR